MTKPDYPNVDSSSAQYWEAQAMMWHDKYKAVLAIETDCHRYRMALERLAGVSNEGLTKERVRLIVRKALGGGE